MEDDLLSAKKSPAWSELSEIRLCTLVRENWSLLFGEIKGCGAVKVSVSRRKKWGEIADAISREYTVYRSAEQCRKKYHNLKSRSIKKISGYRHPPTGGGSAELLTGAETVIADHLQTHEVVTGIPGGMDSDACTAPDVISEPTLGTLPTEADGIVAETPQLEAVCPSKKRKYEKEKKKRSAETSIQQLTQENLMLDNIKIQEDTKRIHLQMEVLKEQKETLICIKELAITAKEYFSRKSANEFSSGNSFIDSMF